nr:hypothetical protein [Tanacetum cinerariifolium]
MSWIGLPKFADDTIIDYSRPSPTIESNTNDTNKNSSVTETRESSNIITSKPAIKFVKAVDRPAERPTTNKVETAKKPSVKYRLLSATINLIFKAKDPTLFSFIIKLKNKDGGNVNAQGWVYAVRKAEKKRNASRDPDSNVVTGSIYIANSFKVVNPSTGLIPHSPYCTNIQTKLLILLPLEITQCNNQLDIQGRRSYLFSFIKWYQSLVRSFDQKKNNIQAQQKKKMVKTSSSSENKPCCSKACKKNTESLNSKITELTDKLFEAKNMIYHYKLGLAQVEARLAEHRDRELKYCEKIRLLEFKVESSANCIESLKKELEVIKNEKEGLESKRTGFKSATKDLDHLIGSEKSDKIKEGLGYSVVPPPSAQIYSPPKKDMSWIGLPEFADDTIIDYSRPSPTIESNTNDTNKNSFVTETRESSNIITSKPAIKFVKAVDRPAERPTTNKVETTKKPSVKYVELYQKTTKSSKIRGNQRNRNNLKSHQLGANFVMKKKACYNSGGIDHLSYDCGKWVKMGRSCPKNNNTHKSMQPRPAIHRVDRFPTVDLKFSIAARRVKTTAPRLNMNST